jgi:hypothetical protein
LAARIRSGYKAGRGCAQPGLSAQSTRDETICIINAVATKKPRSGTGDTERGTSRSDLRYALIMPSSDGTAGPTKSPAPDLGCAGRSYAPVGGSAASTIIKRCTTKCSDGRHTANKKGGPKAAPLLGPIWDPAPGRRSGIPDLSARGRWSPSARRLHRHRGLAERRTTVGDAAS